MRYLIALFVGLLLMGGAFYAGYRYRKPEIVTQIEVKEVEKVVTKTVTETVVKPGGERVVTETVVQEKDVIVNKPVLIPAPTLPRPNWSLGVLWDPTTARDYMPAGAELGYRIGGDFWVTGTGNWQEPSVLIGIRYHF